MSHVRAAAAAVVVVGQVAFTRESISRLIWVGIDWHGSLLALWQTSDLADLIKCQTGLTFPLLLCHLWQSPNLPRLGAALYNCLGADANVAHLSN